MATALQSLVRWRDNVVVRRVIGWAVVAVAVIVLAVQVNDVVKKHSGLPYIRHSVYWHKRIYEQALANKSPAIATEIAPFYLVERVLKHTELRVGRSLVKWRWHLEEVGRTHVTIGYDIGDLPADAWADLDAQASHTGALGKRKLFLLAKDPTVTSYVFFATMGDGPLYIVPETLYRSRVAARRGANLSAP